MQPSTAIIPLSFDNHEIRAADLDGNPWFVATDVCKALGIRNSRDAVARLESDERADVALTDTSSNGVTQSRMTTVLSEAGVYTIALRCRDAMKPGTGPYRFRKWVTGVALPALRRGQVQFELTGDIRQTIGGIVKSVVHKEISAILPAMIQSEVMSGRYSIVEGVSALEVAEMAGYGAGRRPRGLTQFITRRVGRFHEDRGVPVRRSRHGSGQVRLFDEATARTWLRSGGSRSLENYVAERRGQGKLRLISGSNARAG